MTDTMLQTIVESAYMRQAGVFNTKMVTGAIIGKAVLVNCVPIDTLLARLIREQHPEEFAFGDFTPGRYAWVMEF